jgi:hypothetical protein
MLVPCTNGCPQVYDDSFQSSDCDGVFDGHVKVRSKMDQPVIEHRYNLAALRGPHTSGLDVQAVRRR